MRRFPDWGRPKNKFPFSGEYLNDEAAGLPQAGAEILTYLTEALRNDLPKDKALKAVGFKVFPEQLKVSIATCLFFSLWDFFSKRSGIGQRYFNLSNFLNSLHLF